MTLHALGSEPRWQQVLRATQSTWREAQGLTAGPYRDTKLGSTIEPAQAEAGRNFLTDACWSRAQRELAATHDVHGVRRVLQRDRLLGNLLSSQPLCFNLFAELDEDRALASRVFRLLLPGVVAKVERIELEWSPGRAQPEYLDNHSAFDVAVFHTEPGGGRGVLGIEMKYHEGLGGGAPSIRQRAVEVAATAGITADASAPPWSTTPVAQLLLDRLLAESITQNVDDDLGTGRFLMMFPAANAACWRAANAFDEAATGSGLQTMTLETFTGALQACSDSPWVAEFRSRYLDHTRAAALGVSITR